MDPRCASLPRRTKPFRRTIERGQKSSRCYAKRYEAMETSWSRKRLAFSPPNSPIVLFFFFYFPRFPTKQVASFPAPRLLISKSSYFFFRQCITALIRYPADITNVEIFIRHYDDLDESLSLRLSRFSSLYIYTISIFIISVSLTKI